MADRIEDIIKLLVEEGGRRGFLTYQEMNKLLEDQFLPPERMDQVFTALEDASVEVVDEKLAVAQRQWWRVLVADDFPARLCLS